MHRFWGQDSRIIVTIFIAILLLYLPILKNPLMVLGRGNDLQEYYWPLAFYQSKHILSDHTLPFWNNMFFSGTPLLPDPQSMLFYPPNILFLILPMSTALITWFMFHTLLGGVGTYLATRQGLQYSKTASLFSALLYIAIPKTAGFLEAGHITLVAAAAWLPCIGWALINLIKIPSFKQSTFLAVSLTGLFFLFPTLAAVAAVIAFILITSAWALKSVSPKSVLFLAVGALLTAGLTAITLFPQLEWIPQTTRYILLKDRDTYPKWSGKSEFIKAIYPHLLGGKEFIYSLDSEKWIAMGLVFSFLALVGFWKLSKKYKVLTLVFFLSIILVSLNNISPINSYLLSSDWYVLSRVPTRNWAFVCLITVFLAGYGVQVLIDKKMRRLAWFIGILCTAELVFLSWTRLEKPVPVQNDFVPEALYQFFKQDPEIFRVFCTTRCLPQRKVAEYNLQTIEGYATIYQKNYYDNFIQLSQVYWDRYSSTLPSASIYKFRDIQPIASILGEANVKYVISPYILKDKQFTQVAQFDKYLIFENTQFKTRAYFYIAGPTHEIEAPVIKYKPGDVVVDALKHKAGEIVFAETWSPGWKAKADGKRIKVEEAGNKLMRVKIPQETKIVEFFYYPESYRLGRAISIFTLLAILFYYIFEKKKNPGKFRKAK